MSKRPLKWAGDLPQREAELWKRIWTRGYGDLFAMCCTAGNVRPVDVLSRDRSKTVVRTRALFARSLRDIYSLSYPEIGHLIGKDHTSVMYLVKLPPDLTLDHAPVIDPEQERTRIRQAAIFLQLGSPRSVIQPLDMEDFLHELEQLLFPKGAKVLPRFSPPPPDLDSTG